ncbi:hypothetical protein BDZ94DRAFT_1167502, partial [Collybia nuda]
VPGGMGWVDACQKSPIVIKGVTYQTPDVCDDRGFAGGVVGKWFISSNDAHCMPHWGSNAKDNCVKFGKRKWYSRLWDIKSGVDWMTMCHSTPNTVDGKRYDKPTYCDDKAIGGAWGGTFLSFFVHFPPV